MGERQRAEWGGCLDNQTFGKKDIIIYSLYYITAHNMNKIKKKGV